jgi:hypothetical protein
MPVRPATLPRPDAHRAAAGRVAAVVTLVAGALGATTLVACGRGGPGDAAARAPRDTVVVVAPPRVAGGAASGDTAYRGRPGYVVDSIRPIEEELRRFRAGLVRPTALEGGAPSREALVRRFLDALARRDTSALARLALTRAEFAWLVYPESPLMRPPYRQPPGMVWLQLQMGGRPALHRLLDRLGGRRLAYVGHACDAEPAVEGANRLWRACRVAHVRAPGDTVRARLFGVVVERGGRFKFANFASDY